MEKTLSNGHAHVCHFMCCRTLGPSQHNIITKTESLTLASTMAPTPSTSSRRGSRATLQQPRAYFGESASSITRKLRGFKYYLKDNKDLKGYAYGEMLLKSEIPVNGHGKCDRVTAAKGHACSNAVDSLPIISLTCTAGGFTEQSMMKYRLEAFPC